MSNDHGAQGPVPWFDHHLKVINDSYITFFQERVKLEEAYVDALFKLHTKSRAIDSLLDQVETGSTRLAWREVRTELEHEAETRTAFVNTIKTDVLGPLSAFKDTQERTRKRIKDDVKDSFQAHHEMAENTLPRLKRIYLKRCQEVEDHKAQERAVEAQKQLLSNPIVSPMASTSTFASMNSTTILVSPIPTTPSNTSPTQRARSPSASGGLSDLAQHGKKQFGQLLNFLNEKRDGARDGNGILPRDVSSVSTGGGSAPMRGVKAKREADEADKEYRKGVFHLETLRLRREKILLAGYGSLEELVKESADVVRDVLSKYRDVLEVTATANASLARDLDGSVESIAPARDASLVHAAIPNAVARALPKRVLYYNYAVGECNDLIFGVSLVDYAVSRGLPEGDAPDLVRKCIAEIEDRGMEAEGIYRVSGRHATVQELMRKIERNEAEFKFNPLIDDVYTVCSVLKLYLRELPEPVFKFPLPERVQYSEKREEHVANNFLILRSKLRRLPPVHQATLRVVVEHLARVAGKSARNKMDPKNLAVIFGAVIFGEDELPKNGDVLSVGVAKDTLMEDLITYAPLVFTERNSPTPARPSSPPLPAAPSNEIPAGIDNPYGSVYTKHVILPPRSDHDFAPRMPPRPADSIHPSRRHHTTSSMESAPPLPPRQPKLRVDTLDIPSSLHNLAGGEGSQGEDDRTAVLERGPLQSSPISVESGVGSGYAKSQHSPARSRHTSPLVVTTELPPAGIPMESDAGSNQTSPMTAQSFQSTRTSFDLDHSAQPASELATQHSPQRTNTV